MNTRLTTLLRILNIVLALSSFKTTSFLTDFVKKLRYLIMFLCKGKLFFICCAFYL